MQSSSDAETPGRLVLEPMDPQLTNIQPGGGFIVQLEFLWGYLRRGYLKRFSKSYVARMKSTRQGTENRCPHDVLDPRDLKFYRNQDGYFWSAADDPFVWRDRLPFARAGLAELLFFLLTSLGGAAISVVFAVQAVSITATVLLGSLAAAWIVIGILIVWFFRDPARAIPQDDGLVVSPADGKVVTIERMANAEFIEGPAVVIGVFLSIFNVHINRIPVAGRVIGLRYKPGKYLNALRPESARENEQLAICLEESTPPYRRMVVRQIAGAIARRIVCWLKPGDVLQRGDQIGMIKLGSRTELVLPDTDDLQIQVRVGDKIQAGATVLAAYNHSK